MKERVIDPLEVATGAARCAGEILLRHHTHLVHEELEFKGLRDLLTRADREAERSIVEGLETAFPRDAILAEESGDHAGESGMRWIVDPLDGTTNFVHGLPIFAVSIARVDPSGAPEVAVVYLPRLDELLAARRGCGATLNDRAIHVSTRSALPESILATGFHYERHARRESNLDHFAKFALRVRGIRRMGSAASDLAFIAAGRLDGFWELHLSPWDVAAGGLLVREAGGKVSDARGGEDWLHGGSIVASNGSALHESIIETLAHPIPGWASVQRHVGGA